MVIVPNSYFAFPGMVSISIRKLSETEPTYLVALYFTIFGIIASLVTIPLFGDWKMPVSGFDLFILTCVGVSGGIGNLALTAAFKNAEVSIVTPLKYLSLIYAIIFVDIIKELPITLIMRPFNFETFATKVICAKEEMLEFNGVVTIVLIGIIPIIVLNKAINLSSN